MKTYVPGFTLLETLVTITVSTIVLIAVTGMIQDFYKGNAYLLDQTNAINSARRSVEHAVANLREASYAADGSYPLQAAGTSTVTFFSDISSTTVLEKVRYYRSGDYLYRGVTLSAGNPPTYVGQPEAVTLVVDNIRNDISTPIFNYYNNVGTDLGANPIVSAVTSIKITVLTDVNPYRAPQIYTLSAVATLRNLIQQK